MTIGSGPDACSSKAVVVGLHLPGLLVPILIGVCEAVAASGGIAAILEHEGSAVALAVGNLLSVGRATDSRGGAVCVATSKGLDVCAVGKGRLRASLHLDACRGIRPNEGALLACWIPSERDVRIVGHRDGRNVVLVIRKVPVVDVDVVQPEIDLLGGRGVHLYLHVGGASRKGVGPPMLDVVHVEDGGVRGIRCEVDGGAIRQFLRHLLQLHRGKLCRGGTLMGRKSRFLHLGRCKILAEGRGRRVRQQLPKQCLGERGSTSGGWRARATARNAGPAFCKSGGCAAAQDKRAGKDGRKCSPHPAATRAPGTIGQALARIVLALHDGLPFSSCTTSPMDQRRLARAAAIFQGKVPQPESLYIIPKYEAHQGAPIPRGFRQRIGRSPAGMRRAPSQSDCSVLRTPAT